MKGGRAISQRLKTTRADNGLSTFHFGRNITHTVKTLESTTPPLHGEIEVPHEFLPLGLRSGRELEAHMKP